MRYKYFIGILLILVLCFLASCTMETEGANDLITSGIEKINDSNSVTIHFQSESILENDVIAHSILNSSITYEKEPFNIYHERISSYYEDDQEKYITPYSSHITTENGELKQYEKMQRLPNETPQWEQSAGNSNDIKELADYYNHELDAYLFMFSSNINNFKKRTEEVINDKNAIKFEGYFTKESASDCIEKYLKTSFEKFGSDFAEAHPLTRIANSLKDTPVLIWFDKENGEPVCVKIDLIEAEQSYWDSLEEATELNHKTVDSSYITIEIKLAD